jgi:cystathionine beta-lyase/cystathionine gamma-synthase
MREAIEYRKYVGHMISPDDAYRLQTQIKTFRLRFIQQCKNAAAITSVLKSSRAVRKVWYPGLPEHETHSVALKLFADRGFGGMITFDFAGGSAEEKRKKRDLFISAVSEDIKIIPSLGDPKTIIMPVESVWGVKYPEPGLIRMSAGFEETEVITAIVKEALGKL